MGVVSIGLDFFALRAVTAAIQGVKTGSKIVSAMGKVVLTDVAVGWGTKFTSEAMFNIGMPPQLVFAIHIGTNLVVAKHNTKVKNVNNMKDLETTLGLKPERIQDLMKRTRKNLDDFAKVVKNGELDSLLEIPEMNMKYLMKQTGKNADEITDWLKRNDIDLKNIKPKNVDDIIKGASGADDVVIDDFLSGMNAEDAKKYLEWNDLVMKGVSAEERYNFSKFGSIKTQLEYTTSTGLKLQGTTGKTTTIVGNYNNDMKYIVDELGNIKSTNFGPKNGGFNILNVPDEEFSRLGREGFWKKYNEPWLQSAIDRNDIIKVATYPSDSVRYWFDADGVRHLTGYGRELKVLEDAGYVYDSSIQSFVK